MKVWTNFSGESWVINRLTSAMFFSWGTEVWQRRWICASMLSALSMMTLRLRAAGPAFTCKSLIPRLLTSTLLRCQGAHRVRNSVLASLRQSLLAAIHTLGSVTQACSVLRTSHFMVVTWSWRTHIAGCHRHIGATQARTSWWCGRLGWCKWWKAWGQGLSPAGRRTWGLLRPRSCRE